MASYLLHTFTTDQAKWIEVALLSSKANTHLKVMIIITLHSIYHILGGLQPWMA